MVIRAATQRWARAAAALLAVVASPLPAQEPAPPPALTAAQQTELRQRIATAAERWLASDQAARAELERVVALLLEQPEVGIEWLGALLPAALAQPGSPRAKGAHSLVAHTTLGYVQRQRATNITYQGQFALLARLQPHAGDFLFGLLLDTPDWYPLTHRIQLVAPLRDLYPRRPDAARVDAVARLAADAEIEPEDLRRALAAMLWQWGDRAPGQAVVARLIAATAEGDAVERVQTTLELADFHNQLREHEQAARAHRSAQALAKDAGVELRPIAWYAAACVHALAGDVERGIAALGACVAQLESPHLDSSLRLPRSMFDRDPELARLRADPRWEPLLQRAFPPAARSPDGGR